MRINTNCTFIHAHIMFICIGNPKSHLRPLKEHLSKFEHAFFPNNGTLKGSSRLKIKDPYDALPGSRQADALWPHPYALL